MVYCTIWIENNQCNVPHILENILRHLVQNEWLFPKCQVNSAIFQSYWNFEMDYGQFNYIQVCIFCRLKVLFNFYVRRTVRRQDFGAKFNHTFHNGAPVADILKITWCSQFKVLMAIILTQCISLLANDYQFRYYVLKQCFSGIELIRAHWDILNCSPMFKVEVVYLIIHKLS